jgi:hypothetical protein
MFLPWLLWPLAYFMCLMRGFLQGVDLLYSKSITIFLSFLESKAFIQKLLQVFSPTFLTLLLECIISDAGIAYIQPFLCFLDLWWIL